MPEIVRSRAALFFSEVDENRPRTVEGHHVRDLSRCQHVVHSRRLDDDDVAGRSVRTEAKLAVMSEQADPVDVSVGVVGDVSYNAVPNFAIDTESDGVGGEICVVSEELDGLVDDEAQVPPDSGIQLRLFYRYGHGECGANGERRSAGFGRGRRCHGLFLSIEGRFFCTVRTERHIYLYHLAYVKSMSAD